MRKIHPTLENPVDNLIIEYARLNAPFYKRFDLSPNTLTIMSCIFGILSALSIMMRYSPIISAMLYFIAYYYDCLDGYYARQYNMCTSFGDKLDHGCDLLKFVLVWFAIWTRFESTSTFLLIFIPYLILVSLTLIHLACQELHYENTENQPVMSALKKLCPNKDIIQITRHIGNGTLTIITILVILQNG
jgi:phosphatidylglycerophosphate synthase